MYWPNLLLMRMMQMHIMYISFLIKTISESRDDGHGMSYQNGEVKVLERSRCLELKEEESMTRSGERRKMGRKRRW